jgi:uncharacterized protein YaaQ
MKLVVAIIQDYDTDPFLKAVSAHRLGATRIASAGGFLRTGNTTVLLAVQNDEVELVKKLLAQHCRVREVSVDAIADLWAECDIENISPTRLGGGVAFVARITHFERMLRVTESPEKAIRQREED